MKFKMWHVGSALMMDRASNKVRDTLPSKKS